MADRQIEAAPGRPPGQRARALQQAAGLVGQARAPMLTDVGVADSEAVAQRQRLREVAGGDLHLVAVAAQLLDHRPQHEHVGRIRQVDPDAHRPRRDGRLPRRQAAAAIAATTSRACSAPSTGLIGSATLSRPSASVTGKHGGVPLRYGAIDGCW